MTASDEAVLIAATAVPTSQRAASPTKPLASTLDTPESRAAEVVVVVVVVSASEVELGGAASRLRGCDPVSPPVKTIAAARPAARPRVATVPASNNFWVRPN